MKFEIQIAKIILKASTTRRLHILHYCVEGYSVFMWSLYLPLFAASNPLVHRFDVLGKPIKIALEYCLPI